jgi:hypothetical protein
MLLASCENPLICNLNLCSRDYQTVLDLTSIGSASAATVSKLRPVFLTITVLILLDSIRRQGLNHRNLLRILASVLVLFIPKIQGYYQQAVAPETPKHSCH